MSTVADQDAASRRASPLLPSPAPRRQEASQSDLAFFLVDAYSANPVTRARSASNGSRSSNSETAPSPAMAADSARLAYYDPQSQAYAPTANAPTEADNTAAGLPETRGSKQVQAETTTGGRPAKHRRRTTAEQYRTLEGEFTKNSKPDIPRRNQLGELLNMSPREIQVWFQNRRAKEKRIAQKAQLQSHMAGNRVEELDMEAEAEPSWAAQALEAQDAETLDSMLRPPHGPGSGWAERRSVSADPALAIPRSHYVEGAYDEQHSLSVEPSPELHHLPLRSAPAAIGWPAPPPEAFPFQRPQYRHLPHLQLPPHSFYSHQPHSAPPDQRFASFYEQLSPASDSTTLAGATSPAAEHPSPWNPSIADQAYRTRVDRSDSIATSFTSNTSAEATTPTSIHSGWSLATGITSPTGPFPTDYDFEARRASCPAEFLASFSHLLPSIPAQAALPQQQYSQGLPAGSIGSHFGHQQAWLPQSNVYNPAAQYRLPEVQYAQPVYGAAFSGDQQAPLLLEDYGQSSGPPINRLETAPLGTKAEPFNGIAEPLNPLAEEALEGPAPFPHAPPQFLVNDELPPATYGPTSTPRRPTPSRKHRSQSSIKSTWRDLNSQG